MRALHFQPSSTLTLSTTTLIPTPSPTQYLIRVRAAAITADELTWTETLARPKPIPAHDVCGTVVQTPSLFSSGTAPSGIAPTFNVGDEVVALISFSRDGAAAEYVVAEVDELARKPQRLTDVEAAAVPLSFLTAWQALFLHAIVEPGFPILILGAAGGVGVMAVQLARWLGMSRIVGTCSAKNAGFVRGLGASEVVDYSCEKVEGNFDVVLDCVGGKARDEYWQNVKMGGAFVSVAAPIQEDMRMRYPTVRSIFFVVEPNGLQLEKAVQLIDKDELRPVVDRVFALGDGPEAFALLGKRHTRGKIVLEV